MKAVIYAHYSSDNQREESIEGQLRECTAYCKKNEITIVRTYIDYRPSLIRQNGQPPGLSADDKGQR